MYETTDIVLQACKAHSARAVLELTGVHDVLTKAYGSTSPKNVVKATLNALTQLRSREQVEQLRGVKLS